MYEDDLEWLLVEAVKLAGGESTLAIRRLGQLPRSLRPLHLLGGLI